MSPPTLVTVIKGATGAGIGVGVGVGVGKGSQNPSAGLQNRPGLQSSPAQHFCPLPPQAEGPIVLISGTFKNWLNIPISTNAKKAIISPTTAYVIFSLAL